MSQYCGYHFAFIYSWYIGRYGIGVIRIQHPALSNPVDRKDPTLAGVHVTLYVEKPDELRKIEKTYARAVLDASWKETNKKEDPQLFPRLSTKELSKSILWFSKN